MFRIAYLALPATIVLALGCQKVTGEDGYADPNGSFDLFPGPDGAIGGNPDSDGDGLSDADEAAIGSDPNLEDTDGDGYLDGEEVEQYTDPTDKKDHPYFGGWPIGACRNDVSGDGWGVGEVALGFELKDQYGDKVKLHDFCDQVVLLVSSAIWCGPCNAEAPEVGGWYDEYADDGLMVITLLSENNNGQPNSQDDLTWWMETHGLNHPVVADDGGAITGALVGGGSYGIPTMHLLSQGNVIEMTDGHADPGMLESMLNGLE